MSSKLNNKIEDEIDTITDYILESTPSYDTILTSIKDNITQLSNIINPTYGDNINDQLDTITTLIDSIDNNISSNNST